MVPPFLLVDCNLSYIVDLFAALHELASASARTLLKLASSVHARFKTLLSHLKQTTTATATGTLLNKRFNEQNNSCARAL